MINSKEVFFLKCEAYCITLSYILVRTSILNASSSQINANSPSHSTQTTTQVDRCPYHTLKYTTIQVGSYPYYIQNAYSILKTLHALTRKNLSLRWVFKIGYCSKRYTDRKIQASNACLVRQRTMPFQFTISLLHMLIEVLDPLSMSRPHGSSALSKDKEWIWCSHCRGVLVVF